MAEPHTVDTTVGPLADLPRLTLVRIDALTTFAKDIVALTKPRITAMALIVAAGAMLLAPGRIALVDALWSLAGIAAAVAGAGALNMLIERDVDALMTRTADRPLPSRRMHAFWALVVGGGLSAASLPILWVHASKVAVVLTAFSLFVYVLVYTPMKRTSPWALVVGAVPGAMPALMGSSSVSATFDRAGVALFAFVFLWQIPHFLAIALYRETEYAAAGHKVAPSVWGQHKSRVVVVASALLLAACGVSLRFAHVGGLVSLVVAIALGAWFVAVCARGLFIDESPATTDVWGRRVFRASLVYQTVLFGALAVDTLMSRL